MIQIQHFSYFSLLEILGWCFHDFGRNPECADLVQHGFHSYVYFINRFSIRSHNKSIQKSCFANKKNLEISNVFSNFFNAPDFLVLPPRNSTCFEPKTDSHDSQGCDSQGHKTQRVLSRFGHDRQGLPGFFCTKDSDSSEDRQGLNNRKKGTLPWLCSLTIYNRLELICVVMLMQIVLLA